MKKKLCLMLAMLLVAGMIIPSNVSARTWTYVNTLDTKS